MALTTPQFQAWLENPLAIRCILVEVTANISGTETTLYLSNRNYVTGPTDSPANTVYQPVLKSGVSFTEKLELDGGTSLSFGDIAIDNTNGVYDSWLTAAWQSRPISIYLGDPSFTRDNFTKIFSGLVDDISSSDRNTLNLSLRDVLERLNTPITQTVLGNYFKGNIVATTTYDNANKDQVRPLIFGEVFNITPLLMDPTELEYMVHDGPIERLIEVRDNAVPLTAGVGYQVNLATGTFKLLTNPAGAVTCSVQGDKNTVYNASVQSIIRHIIKTYGNPDILGAVTDSDIEFPTTEFSQTAGIYITQKENLLSVCQELANSVGAQLCATRTGKLKLLQITVPAAGGTVITDDDIVQSSLSISQKPTVQSTYRLGYCRNWTVQDRLLTGIPAVHKDFFAQPWISVTSTNETAKNLYKQNTLPEQKDTLLIDNTPIPPETKGTVTLEAERLVALRSVQRYVYRFTTTIKFLQSAILANMITLTHRRFGLSAGAAAQIISSEIDWDTGFITLEVLV
jgi:hypothetical protein